MNDFDLTQRLREARPPLPARGEPLGDPAERTLHGIMSGSVVSAEPARGRRRTPIYLAVAASLAALLAIALGFALIARPAPVYATTTPPLLEPTPVDGTAKELLMQLGTDLVDPRTRTVRFQSWSLALEIDEEGAIDSVAVAPTVRTVEHGRDGSRIEERRGEPYDSLGNPIQVDGYDVGGLVWEQDFPPGEFPYAFGEPPVEASAYAEFLQPGSTVPLTSGDALGLISSLLGERRLTPAQTRAALEYLSTFPDLEVEGRVIDRLGRSGISFATNSRAPGEYVDRIIVSDEGLGFLSYESTYVGTSRDDVQAPAVVTYTAWE